MRFHVLLALTLAMSFSRLSSAQEFVVYTTVEQASDGKAFGPILSRSHTIVHAGKSYDYMEQIGEVVIWNPNAHKFTILHEGRIGTKVAFDELKQYVNVGQQETESYAREISLRPDGRDAAEALMFQLVPAFETTVSESGLQLNSPHWTYTVETVTPTASDYSSLYADYADAAARLNFVLHPESFFPAVRESLNNQLRRHGRVPTSVTLSADIGDHIELVAQHQFRWTLGDIDRRQIRKFDRLAESEDVEWIGFREYQKRILSVR